MKFLVGFCMIGMLLAASVNADEPDDHELAAKSMETTSGILETYNKTLDTVIDWNLMKESAKSLEAGIGRFSSIAGGLVGSIMTSMLNSEHNYFTASQSIFTWCGETIPLLDGYKEIFVGGIDEKKAGQQKEILLHILDSGLAQFTVALDQINLCISGFDNSTGQLLTLDNQLGVDYAEGSKKLEEEKDKVRTGHWYAWFFPPLGLGLTIYNEVKTIPDLDKSIKSLREFFQGLHTHVGTTVDLIKAARVELKKEVVVIDNLQSQTKVTKVFVAMKAGIQSLIEKNADKLIEQCKAYRVRHGEVQTKV